MNSDMLINEPRPKKDYQQLHQVLKSRCEDISKDNDALSSRLISLKLLIYKAENQCRLIRERLDNHGIDYQAAALASSSTCSQVHEFAAEKPPIKVNRKKKIKVVDLNKSPTSSLFSVNQALESDPGLSNPFSTGDNII